MLEDIPKPSELCRVSGRNGDQFTLLQSSYKYAVALLRPALDDGTEAELRARRIGFLVA